MTPRAMPSACANTAPVTLRIACNANDRREQSDKPTRPGAIARSVGANCGFAKIASAIQGENTQIAVATSPDTTSTTRNALRKAALTTPQRPDSALAPPNLRPGLYKPTRKTKDKKIPKQNPKRK